MLTNAKWNLLSNFISVCVLLMCSKNVSSYQDDLTVKTLLCKDKYNAECFKFDTLKLAEKIGDSAGNRLEILSGIYLTTDVMNGTEIPKLKGNTTEDFKDYIAKRVEIFLSSLSLKIKIVDGGTVNTARKIGEEILISFSSDMQETGRRRKGMGGAAWAAGTVAAVGAATLAAISGKALMTSMLALMLAGAGAMRSNGGGGNQCGKSSDIAARTIEVVDNRLDSGPTLEQPRPIYRPYLPIYPTSQV